MTGIELLEWVKKYKPTPVILITGFSKILETKKVEELGADDFINKPLKKDELKQKIEKILGSPEALKPLSKLDENKKFCKVPIEDFVSNNKTEFDIYIKLGDSKYIKISHKGAKIQPEKINFLKSKQINYLYILQEDFKHLVGFSVLVAKAVSASGKVDPEKKSRFIKYTGELISQQSFVSELDQPSLNNAKTFITTVVDVLTEDEETFSLLDCLRTHTDFLFSHSISSSLMAVIIAKELGWQSPQTLFKLAFSGLFMDIGLKEIPSDILEKPRVRLTLQERQLIETHPMRGKEILESLKTAPSDAIQITFEHHENIIGQGYPRQIDAKAMHPLTKVVQVADIFCSYVIKNNQHHKTISVKEALHNMKTYRISEIDSEIFDALCKVIQKNDLLKSA